jgi:zinc finger CCHC domain-containing protein 9
MTRNETGSKGKQQQHAKPKMTKEERRKKYTEIARKRRDKQQSFGGGIRGNSHNNDSRKKNVCYNCRQPGHNAADCPTSTTTNDQQSSGVVIVVADAGVGEGILCYKCGSTEHALHLCPKRKQGDRNDLPYATCFVCKEKGHLASTCPQNEKGIYVNGGSCRVCGSQQHLATHCPEKKKIQRNKSGGTEENDVEDYLEQAPAAKLATAVENHKRNTHTDMHSSKRKRRVVIF